MPVGYTAQQEANKRRRRLKITKKAAAAVLAKKKELDAIRKANRRKARIPGSSSAAAPHVSPVDGHQYPLAPLPESLHPVAAAIVEAVAKGHLEEVAVYEPVETPQIPPAGKKTWWDSLKEYWRMIGKL